MWQKFHTWWKSEPICLCSPRGTPYCASCQKPHPAESGQKKVLSGQRPAAALKEDVRIENVLGLLAVEGVQQVHRRVRRNHRDVVAEEEDAAVRRGDTGLELVSVEASRGHCDGVPGGAVVERRRVVDEVERVGWIGLEELKSASTSTWEETRKKLDAAVEELKRRYDRVVSRPKS